MASIKGDATAEGELQVRRQRGQQVARR